MDTGAIACQCECVECGSHFMSHNREADLCGLCKARLAAQAPAEAGERIQAGMSGRPAVKTT